MLSLNRLEIIPYYHHKICVLTEGPYRVENPLKSNLTLNLKVHIEFEHCTRLALTL